MLSREFHLHSWLKKIRLAFVYEESSPLIEYMVSKIKETFIRNGHIVQESVDADTDLIITTAQFGQVINWRKALLFTSRMRYKLPKTPTVMTIVPVEPEEFHRMLERFETILEKEPPDPKDYAFEGLAENAYKVLFEQGRRGGPILSLLRMVQGQTKSIRVLLVVGKDMPMEAYLFDLVGAYPKIDASDKERFFNEITYRLVTAVSTREITNHLVVDDKLPHETWEKLYSVPAMINAARELGKRNFFTQMVRIADLVHVPALGEAISSQYSEGCFATWDYDIDALVATVTGSARPVEKDSITEKDLALIVGVRPDGEGALVKHVAGKENDPPSSEAVEMYAIDTRLPRIKYRTKHGKQVDVPVSRSKLHGHRGVAAFDPTRVEHVALDPPYYDFPVSCSTEAQARAIEDAFARSEALRNPDDPRQVVFTILPGHGMVAVEKWVDGKEPFDVLLDYMDKGYLKITNRVPQGKVEFIQGDDGRLYVKDSLYQTIMGKEI